MKTLSCLDRGPVNLYMGGGMWEEVMILCEIVASQNNFVC